MCFHAKCKKESNLNKKRAKRGQKEVTKIPGWREEWSKTETELEVNGVGEQIKVSAFAVPACICA